MRKTIHTLLALGVAAATLAAPAAQAREGSSSRSIGGGIKCYYTYVLQPNGSLVYQQVCGKGV